jgi:DNA-binding CsgD family transcriptional regulator
LYRLRVVTRSDDRRLSAADASTPEAPKRSVPRSLAPTNTPRTQRLLASALEALGWAAEGEPRGIVMLGGGGRVEFASPPARRLLREFFPSATGRRLPPPVQEWLESKVSHPLVAERGTRAVVVRRTDDVLFLHERHAGRELTPREQEVLSWVARGKTNAEVAERLSLAPSTVRKHLENVYAKLGVSTRTAAVARFLGLVDAEAS